VDFDIATERLDGGVFVIALSGEVDLYTAPEFKQQLIDAVAGGARHVVVDLSETTFIDSTTLGVLVGGARRLREKEGDISLVCSDRNIIKIFEITGLNQVFSIAPSRAEALERLSIG
jgi:anti-sigma B factor antagonist